MERRTSDALGMLWVVWQVGRACPVRLGRIVTRLADGGKAIGKCCDINLSDG